MHINDTNCRISNLPYWLRSDLGQLIWPLSHLGRSTTMIRNVLALVGLVVVVKAAYNHYEEFSDLKRKQAERDANEQNKAA